MKIENVEKIKTEYSIRKPDQAHITPIYRFDFIPDIDLLEYKHEIIEVSGDRVKFSTKTEILKSHINILHKNMMETGKAIFCDPIDLGFIMKNHWFWLNQNTFENKCVPYSMIVEDRKGHFMTQHLDNPTILANFIINLADNESSTEFLDYKDTNKVIYKAETKKNTGVLFFNTGGTVHKINVVDDVRHVLMGSILLNVDIR